MSHLTDLNVFFPIANDRKYFYLRIDGYKSSIAFTIT